MACKRFRLIRPAAEQGHPLLFQEAQRGLRVGYLFGDEGGAGEQRGKHSAGEPADPEERHRQVQPGVGTDAPRRQTRLDRAQRVAVRVHNPLRWSAAARREDDDHRVTGSHDGGERIGNATCRIVRSSLRQLVGSPNVAQRRQFGICRSQVLEIAVSAELLHRDQELHRGHAQLRHQFARLHQRAQGHQHRADPGQRDGQLHPSHAVGHDQADAGALAHAGLDEDGSQLPGCCIQLAVGDSRRRIDHRQFGAVLAGSKPHQRVDGRRLLTHRTKS